VSSFLQEVTVPSNATSEKPVAYSETAVNNVANDAAPQQRAAMNREQRLAGWMVWGGVGLAVFTITAIYVTHRDEAAALKAQRPSAGPATTTSYVKPIPF
jgi:hypothetical protein